MNAARLLLPLALVLLAGCVAPPAGPQGEIAPRPAVPPVPSLPAPSAPAQPQAASAAAPDVPPADEPLARGVASWYGPGLHGRRTASGERFDRTDFTAAHRELPFGARLCVRSLVNGRTVVVRINDRGPALLEREIDLSEAAARAIGLVGLGLKQVELWPLAEGDEACPETLPAWQAAPATASRAQRPSSPRKKAPARRRARR